MMKINKLIAATLVAVLLFAAGRVSAQENSEEGTTSIPKNVIKTNPLAVIWSQIPFTGEYRLMYERALGSKMASMISVSYIGPSALINLNNLTEVDDLKVSINGVRVQAAQKFYLTSHDAPKGFYMAPHFSYAEAKLANKSVPGDFIEATFINGSVLAGYQIIGGGGFAMDIFTGLGYKTNTWKIGSGASSFSAQDSVTKVKVSFGMNFGMAF